ncbi:UDP-glucose 4-epimerase GalE [Rheinheimera sp.]|uniref:UDP-glucose 4-epimerase GalE n=1 Tax=Rheinheimera sp. TaxID=1869214 RepID=UPI002621AE78|nr:UDP-glucose 4-epimerase GalE [Rheinheimera sp.]MCA1929376.1 UDP-glucose 4-epimerase GalE [Rheinheimera sp.]
MSYVLLTGGAGYIGSHTALALLNANEQVISFDNYHNSSSESLKRVQQLSGRSLIDIQGDVLDSQALAQVFEQYPIKAVIHFAALKAVGESTAKPLWYYENNVTGTINLCKVMSQYGVKKLVFSSSATVYGAAEQMPIHESAPRSATNPYGQSKLMIEHILADLHSSDPDWKIAVLRYFNPVGADASGMIGENPNGIPNNLMPFITQVAVGKRDKLQVFGSDYPTADGTGVRDFIHVSDLARGHLAALGYLQQVQGIDYINLGTGQGYSVLDVIHSFSKVNQLDIPYVLTDRRPGDIAQCYADPSKAAQVLKWTTEKTLEDMVRDSWNWQKNNPNGYN